MGDGAGSRAVDRSAQSCEWCRTRDGARSASGCASAPAGKPVARSDRRLPHRPPAARDTGDRRQGGLVDERRMVRISKYLAKHLRHQPERIGITLDEGGWVDVDVLLAAAARHGFPISEDELVQVVTANDKRR